MIFRNIPVLLIFFLPLLSLAAPSPERETALFAGGCFWCMQPPFDHWKNRGVISTKVGYTGGVLENPKYEQVSHEKTGHREAIEVVFNPRKVTYEELLELFWKQIDPFDSKGQFCDKGEQYTSAIFYGSSTQKLAAEQSKKRKERELKKEIATAILPAKIFYPAEDYHQSYYEKNPMKYKFYRRACGRDERRKEVWGTIVP